MDDTNEGQAVQYPRPRIVLLPVFIGLFTTLFWLLNIHLLAAAMLGLLLGNICYYLFAVLRIQHLIGEGISVGYTVSRTM